ncbi:zinc finger protein 346 isoform X6 [Cebus imitator]|uniref:Zinc finger protein 346 n=2 Tax=Cebinae TaxID=38070 RepID=A0A2K5QGP6_CEBIM|nr:zinc finger protein 346 isoform X6 [Cebus imitator]XP_032125750.1 zinc finger protein 346 isoform X10 [Sapajus apella]
MEYPAPGTVEAAGSGEAGPYNSSEELERPEPDWVHFDSERARRLWEAASVVQPVGREEVEHMIQKNECLFTNTQCKVCCALLISESQKLAHYQSKKHANKVKRYLAIHGMETLKGETKKLDSDQKSSRSKDKNQCCPICNMTFFSPVVAQSHYLGKTHAKNLKLKQQYTKMEAGKGYPCKTCKIVLNSIKQYQAHISGFKHQNQSPKTVASSLGQIPMQRQPIQKDSTTLED